MEKLSQENQLMLLKTMTLRTGAIHSAQKLQLEMWPRLIRGTTKSTKIELDMEKKVVRYVLGTGKGFRLDKTTKRLFQEITSWTRFLLWDDTDVTFVAKNKVVYDSRQ